MSRRSLRPQLNQIRGWVRQGRTDAWIAHQLEVTVQQIQAFKREQDLEADGSDPAVAEEVDLRAERREPVFHHDWEKRVLAIALATGFLRRWNIDMGRFTIEQMPAAEYLATTYYEHWLWGLERLLVRSDRRSRPRKLARQITTGTER